MKAQFARLSGFAGSLAGRIALILTVGISCAAIGALFVAEHFRRADLDRIRFERAVLSTVDVLRRLTQDPAGTEARMRTRQLVGAHLAPPDVIATGTPNRTMSAEVSNRTRQRVRMFDVPPSSCVSGDPFWKQPRTAGFIVPVQAECWLLRFDRPHRAPLLVSIDMARVTPPPSSTTQPIFLVLVVLASAVLSLVVARAAMAPLRRLSGASRAFARSIDAEPVSVDGPTDVREALAAFNVMQQRVRSGLRDRTRLLAAISHDLQTPLTRLRLRLEHVEDPELRARLIADLSATLTMVKRGLDLARSSESAEEWSTVDLDSLLSALAEDAAEFGHDVRFTSGCGARVRVKPDALGRCLGNLIDNAVKYGGGAELSCRIQRGQVVIAVRDHGAGMPPGLIAHAFEPFVRGAGPADAGGTGIGLAIARAQADTNGGTLTLRNHPDGGLVAELTLPVARRSSSTVPDHVGSRRPASRHPIS